MMAPPGDPREIDATAMVELDMQPDSREAAPFVIPAATPALNGSEPQDTQARHAQLFHELRELRTDVRDLQELLTSIRNGDVTLKTYAGYIQGATGEITNLLQQIHDGDAVQHLQNIWQQMRVCPLLTHP